MISVEQEEVASVNIYNFLLNIEFLEIVFFSTAIGDLESGPSLLGGNILAIEKERKIAFQHDSTRMFAREVACHDRGHACALLEQLGGAAAPCPPINVTDAFTHLARRSGIFEGFYTFDPYRNDTNFLFAAYMLKSISVGAYQGLLSRTTDFQVATCIGRLLCQEAYHAGFIRSTLINSENRDVLRALSRYDGYRSSSDQSLSVIEPLLDASLVDNGPTSCELDPNNVLNLLYGMPNAAGHGGAFFPNGFNGLMR